MRISPSSSILTGSRRIIHTAGDGSDLSRIKMKQLFLTSLAAEVKTLDLVDLPRLYAFVDASTSSVTNSPKLAKIPNLAELATDVRELLASKITMVTVPVGAYAPGSQPGAVDL